MKWRNCHGEAAGCGVHPGGRRLGLAAGACGLVGNWLGTTFFLEKGGRGVKPVMLGVLALFFLRVLGEG